MAVNIVENASCSVVTRKTYCDVFLWFSSGIYNTRVQQGSFKGKNRISKIRDAFFSFHILLFRPLYYSQSLKSFYLKSFQISLILNIKLTSGHIAF